MCGDNQGVPYAFVEAQNGLVWWLWLNMYSMVIFSKGVMERGGKSWKVTQQTVDHFQVDKFATV